MRKIFVLLTLLIAASMVLISCTPPPANNTANKPANAANNTAANSSANAASIETDLKKMTTDMAASLVKGDAAAIEKLYTENYMFVGPDGSVSTRAQRIDAMKNGDTKYETLTYDEISVRSNPEGTGAVVISKATVKGKNMGKEVNGQYRVTHVWGKSPDGWKLASGQTTPITAAATTTASNSASNSSTNKSTNSSTNAAKPPPPPPANK